jgi:photosystem II stability/assembly factor-like uncharacterized protein
VDDAGGTAATLTCNVLIAAELPFGGLHMGQLVAVVAEGPIRLVVYVGEGSQGATPAGVCAPLDTDSPWFDSGNMTVFMAMPLRSKAHPRRHSAVMLASERLTGWRCGNSAQKAEDKEAVPMRDDLCVSLRRTGVLAAVLAVMQLCGCDDVRASSPPGPQESAWFWQNPLPQGNDLYAVLFADGNTGTAVGNGGTILRTTDGGATWERQTSGTTSWLDGVSFTDANAGTAVGEAGTILRTTDGGALWERQTSGTTGRLSAVSFTDANAGTAVGEAGTVLRTTDGGATWVRQPSGTTSWLDGVSFTDANTGTVVGFFGTILRTTDGGATWVRQMSGTASNLQDVSFTDADTGTAVGDGGTILKTKTGGVK